jgi:hypothetical protein
LRKAVDLVVCFIMFILVIIVFSIKILISSDIPINIACYEFKYCVVIIVSVSIIYWIYLEWTNYIIFNLVLISLPANLWLISLVSALKYNYHKYDTILVAIGFISIFTLQLQCAYRLYKN